MKYDYWPPGEIVKVEVVSPGKPYFKMDSLWGAMNYGIALGEGDKRKYASTDLPDEVSSVAAEFMRGPYTFSWSAAPPPGQASTGTPNMLGYLWPRFWGYDDQNARGLIVEVGCAHDYKIHNRRNCYREGTCNKCGYHWVCDSGD